jgi:hypothetical protein
MCDTTITHFTIFGERCSGTHFLQHAIANNFAIKYIKGEKHFFGNTQYYKDVISAASSPNELTRHERECIELYNNRPENVLAFAIVRDPIEWINSFYKIKHHVPKSNREPIERFISCEFYSIYDECDKEYMGDRNWKTKERYRNIFELRKLKCQYMLEELPKKYIHYYFLRYEDLLTNYETVIDQIHRAFNLTRKTESYIPIVRYKGTYNVAYAKQPVILNDKIIKNIWENVDSEQESAMGYFPQ